MDTELIYCPHCGCLAGSRESARGPRGTGISPENAPEIQMTDRVGELTPAQLDHLSRGLEHAHEMTLKGEPGGRFWLECIGEGGAVLIRTDVTVGKLWEFAAVVSTTRAEYEAGEARGSLPNP